MRENTRCDVEEPMSTPTLSTQIWSSSPSVRPVLEKKIRPPSASSAILLLLPHRHAGRRQASASPIPYADGRDEPGHEGDTVGVCVKPLSAACLCNSYRKSPAASGSRRLRA